MMEQQMKPIQDITHQVQNKSHKRENSFQTSSAQSLKNHHSRTGSEINYDELLESEKAKKTQQTLERPMTTYEEILMSKYK
jgi:hypothetical protein